MIKLKDLAEEYLASFPIEMEQNNGNDDDFGHLLLCLPLIVGVCNLFFAGLYVSFLD